MKSTFTKIIDFFLWELLEINLVDVFVYEGVVYIKLYHILEVSVALRK